MLSEKKYSSLFLNAQAKYPEHSELIGQLLATAFKHYGKFPKCFYIPGEYKIETVISIMKELSIEVSWCNLQENIKFFRKSTYIYLNTSEDYIEL